MEKIRKNLALVLAACCIVSGLDTMLQISTITFVSFTKHFPREVAIGVSLLLGCGVAWLLDKVNRDLLTPTIEGFTSKKFSTNKGLYSYLLVFCVLLGGASISISYYTRDQVAASIVSPPTLHNITAETAKLGGNETAALEAQKADLKATYKKEIQAAKSTKIAALAATGNAWAAQKQSSLINSIEAKLSTKTEAINGKIAALLDRQSENKNRLVTQLQSENVAAINAANTKIDVVSSLLMYISIGCTLGMFFASLGLAWLWSAYKIGQNPLPDVPNQRKNNPENNSTPPNSNTPGARTAALRNTNRLRDTVNVTSMETPPDNTVITPPTPINSNTVNTEIDQTVNIVYQNGGLIVVEKEGDYKAIFNSLPMDKTKLSQYISVFQGRYLKAQSQRVSDELKNKIAILQKCKTDMYG